MTAEFCDPTWPTFAGNMCASHVGARVKINNEPAGYILRIIHDRDRPTVRLIMHAGRIGPVDLNPRAIVTLDELHPRKDG